ncbi:MAG TPA: methionyl-tRNA formyltransferase [Gammaproteobacteria bacterium]|nr:methionyl-tRNA formyltransferase [Gammaproteobacteria bacterium]
MRIVFAGTPAFAVPALDALIQSPHAVVAAYTQPDRPAGRGRRLAASPVKQRALDAGIEVRQPVNLKDDAERATLAALEPDVMIVVAYGLILPAAILAVPRLGCINIHASLLPRWRGAAPIQRAILAGDRDTGVSIMRMEAGLDTGPVLAQTRTPIAPDDTAESLHDRLAALGAKALLDTLDELAAGTAQARAQTGEAVYAAKLDKAEARLDWNEPAAALARRVRAFTPWPVAETRLDGAQLRIWDAEALPDNGGVAPGTVISTSDAGIDVAAGSGRLRLRAVQRAGGKRVEAAAFARGAALAGKVLG